MVLYNQCVNLYEIKNWVHDYISFVKNIFKRNIVITYIINLCLEVNI